MEWTLDSVGMLSQLFIHRKIDQLYSGQLNDEDIAGNSLGSAKS